MGDLCIRKSVQIGDIWFSCMEKEQCIVCSHFLSERFIREKVFKGLLLRPSCKVGDTVYRINIGARKPIIPLRVVEVRFKVVGNYIREKICCSDDFMSKTASCIYCKEDIGTKVFLCKSEAEQKLLRYTLYKEGWNDKRSKTKHEKHV